MRKSQKIKVKYVYLEPNTPEEKAEQQRRLDEVFDMIFDNMMSETNNKER